jgi:hypothetical protein
MKLSYGDAFKHFGIGGYGYRGAPWFGMRADGVLVMMAHRSYFKLGEDGVMRYIDTDPPYINAKSKANAFMLRRYYYGRGRKIVLMVGDFRIDGDSETASKYKHWTGEWFMATIDAIPRDGHCLVATCDSPVPFKIETTEEATA